MFKKSKIFFLIAETPLHPGSGGEVAGLVDLPIQRERYTDFPKIEASGLKGCIREAFESQLTLDKQNKQYRLLNTEVIGCLKKEFKNIEEIWREKKNGKEVENTDRDGNKLILYQQAINNIFGPEDGEAHAGALAFTDARILLFPVKSLKGVFAWITCPMVLERFKEDLRLAREIPNELNIDFSTLENTLPQQTNICIESKVVLEEYTFEVRESETTSKIANVLAKKIFPKRDTDDPYEFWRVKLEKDLVILSDDDFTQFVKTSTEIITRTKIDNKTGTVASGALWTEEYLPQDTILYSLAMASPLRVEKEEAKGVLKGNT
ncbi:MAG: type III-B CRISPR module RAMP protein Cmr4, partial [Minisyncoccia bacterium]